MTKTNREKQLSELSLPMRNRKEKRVASIRLSAQSDFFKSYECTIL